MSASHEGLARFLLRSEAIASSKIEGLRVSAQQIALAELAQTDDSVVKGLSANAQLVANNITALRGATTEVARRPDSPTACQEMSRPRCGATVGA
nr:Fic/DOC family N-terminal domain-containing protein [Alloactinosynnema sp. L-07]